MSTMQPGDVVGPGDNPPETKASEAQPSTSDGVSGAAEKPAEQPVVESVQPETSEPVEENTNEPVQPESNWEFNNENETSIQPANGPHETVTWTASEYIAHEKNGSWYVLLGLAVFGFAGAVYLITDEVVSTVVILIMGAAFGSFAARKPQELNYVLDNTALSIGGKPYPYAHFKSFTVIDEGAISSIMLMPLKRFMPPLSVYYDPSDEDKITDALAAYLPYEDRKQDPVDRLMRKVRF